MRKNLAKHTAKKLPLAKRVLALCFALIFVCSCQVGGAVLGRQ